MYALWLVCALWFCSFFFSFISNFIFIIAHGFAISAYYVYFFTFNYSILIVLLASLLLLFCLVLVALSVCLFFANSHCNAQIKSVFRTKCSKKKLLNRTITKKIITHQHKKHYLFNEINNQFMDFAEEFKDTYNLLFGMFHLLGISNVIVQFKVVWSSKYFNDHNPSHKKLYIIY